MVFHCCRKNIVESKLMDEKCNEGVTPFALIERLHEEQQVNHNYFCS